MRVIASGDKPHREKLPHAISAERCHIVRRPVPNVYLTSELHSGGIWNAPHIADKTMDRLIDTYVKQIALKDQRKYALQIEKRAQALTPILYLAFTNNISAGSTSVKNYDVEGNSFNIKHTTA